MAITDLNGIIAGLQPQVFFSKAITPTLVGGKPQSLWGLGGNPGAGAFDSTLNGVTLSGTSSQVAGQLRYTNPISGNGYLARLCGMATQAGLLLLCDRLWHNGGYTITSTSAQNTTSPTWPARDNSGSTNGDGVLLGVEVSSAVGAGTPTLTAAYTNQANTSGRTATNVLATAASAAAGSFYFLGLQAGDTGVRSVQSLTLSATWTSGVINLVALRILAALELTNTNQPNAIDAIQGGFPRIYDGTVPFLIFIPQTTTASYVSGQFVYAQG